jgi:hypothetical protein
MGWGPRLDWGGEDDEDAPRPVPRRPLPPPNREQVEIVVCADAGCRSRDVLRHSATADVSYWRCNVCGQRWKEGAGVGAGRGNIA